MAEFLGNIIIGINSIVHNYGLSMIIFTLLIKFFVFPLNYKSRKSMRAMTNLQPQITKLQTKYANDKEKLNQKTAELYRKEGVSPTSGCLPMLISMAILYIMWAGMRWVANNQIAQQAVDMICSGSVEYPYESFLWIKNIWVPDSPFHSVIIQKSDLTAIPTDVWASVLKGLSAENLAALQELSATFPALLNESGELVLTSDAVYAILSQLPGYAEETAQLATINLFITNVVLYVKCNGYFILPVLSAVTQFLMTATQPQPASAQNQEKNSTNAFMKYFFPLFSLYICSSFNAMFAMYWAVSNILGWVETLYLNHLFESKEAKEVKANEEESIK